MCRWDDFIHPKLLHALGTITQSGYEAQHSKSHKMLCDHSKKLKLIMTIGLLTNAMDPRNTLLRLMCYANGLRDKGFKILNAFGIVCSISIFEDMAPIGQDLGQHWPN